MQKLYSFEEKEFNTKVVKAISKAFSFENNQFLLSNQVDRPNKNTYVVKVVAIPPEDKLKLPLTRELESVALYSDICLASYDASKKDYVYQSYIKSPGSVALKKNLSGLELYDRDYNYILINFPNRSSYILGELKYWFVSTLVLIIALLILLGLLVGFLRQRFLIRFQNDFVNNLVHEFKTPISVMKIASGVLNKDSILQQPERLKQYASIINEQTEHLHKQVNRLLDETKTEKKELHLTKQELVISEVIDDAITKLKPLIEQKNARIEILVNEDYNTVKADKAHLEQVIINLLENALKFAKEPKIIISTDRENHCFVLSVKDNGVGIEKKYIKDLFKQYYRVPSGDVHNVKGFGIGLNFVKKIVDLHKGKLSVNSVPGIGTEFKILLPLH